MVKYIIFDFDGTIVDSMNVFISVYNQMAKRENYRLMDYEDVERLKRLSFKGRCEFLHVPFYKLPQLAIEAHKVYKESIKKLNIIKGMDGVLQDLHKRGFKVAIISSNSESNIREFLRLNEIHNVKKIHSSINLFGKDKIITNFLKANNIKRSDVIYVGDEIRDIIASQKSGIDMIWVKWGYEVFERAKRLNPNYIANTPKEILTIVDTKFLN